jgi:repressor LexA
MKILLEEYRTRRRLTQKQLADSSGVPQPMISQIETENVKNPTVGTLAKLARVLRCTVDDLIDDDPLRKAE